MSQLSPALQKVANASVTRILTRLAAAVPGSGPVQATNTAVRPNFDAVSNDADVARDTKLLWAQLDAFSSRKLSSLNDIPASFLKNPQTNFAAYAEKAKAFEKEIDQVDPAFEDAVVNALIPLQRSFVDTLQMAKRMAATSEVRIAELQKELAKVRADLASIDNLDVNAIAQAHPDWEADAARRVAAHDWNLIPDEVDKDLPAEHHDHGHGKSAAH